MHRSLVLVKWVNCICKRLIAQKSDRVCPLDRRTVHGEWRFLANGVGPWFKNAQGKPANSSFAPIFAASNFTGKWRYVGDSPLLAGECGSLFRLPPLYPGTSIDSGGAEAGVLPTHVHKRGCGPNTCASWGARGDHMTLGTWTDGASVDDPGTWTPFSTERTIDMGNLYAGTPTIIMSADEQHQ
jgi:hypothetical protein|eukprot:COSAG02_NODE_274_length_26244_cov_36.943507_15_plen_184_part_00